MLLVEQDLFEAPEYTNPTITTFALGFGSILFSYSGASVFPTIQNDMENKNDFWKSVIIGFTGKFKLTILLLLLSFSSFMFCN